MPFRLETTFVENVYFKYHRALYTKTDTVRFNFLLLLYVTETGSKRTFLYAYAGKKKKKHRREVIWPWNHRGLSSDKVSAENSV